MNYLANLYFNPKNITLTSSCMVTTTVVITLLGLLAAFFVNYSGIVQGMHAVIAYSSVGAAGGLLTFAEILSGMITLAIFYTRNDPPKKPDDAVISSDTSEDSSPPKKSDDEFEEMDVPEGDSETFKAKIREGIALKDFILNNYNNPTAMETLISLTDENINPILLQLIHRPLIDNSSNDWMPNQKLFNAIRKNPETFKKFMHDFFHAESISIQTGYQRLLYFRPALPQNPL